MLYVVLLAVVDPRSLIGFINPFLILLDKLLTNIDFFEVQPIVFLYVTTNSYSLVHTILILIIKCCQTGAMPCYNNPDYEKFDD